MSNLQIKDVPEDIHDELRRRAGQLDMSMREYVLDLLRRDQAGPSRVDWLEELRRLEPIDLGGPAADVVRDGRAARDGRGGRR